MQAGTTVVVGLGSVDKSPRAAKAQDCSAVGRKRPNSSGNKALQPVGRVFERAHLARQFF